MYLVPPSHDPNSMALVQRYWVVRRLKEGGFAEVSGLISKGDILLRVDGKSVRCGRREEGGGGREERRKGWCGEGVGV